MISIGTALHELERQQQMATAALESYTAALRNMSQYAIEIDDSITPLHRQRLSLLAGEVASAGPEALESSRSTLRALLRDYRDKASSFLARLREDLASTTRSLEEILDSLAQGEGDQEARLRKQLVGLRELANGPLDQADAIRSALVPAAEVIQDCMDKIQRQHQLTVSQLQAEIRVLHARIDSLETAVSIDQMTALLTRAEVEDGVRNAVAPYCLLMVRAQGFRLAEVRYGGQVAAECIAAFAKRMRHGMPSSAVIGRWGYEEFLAILRCARSEALPHGRWVTEHLSGAYVCLHNGKTVHVQIQASAGILESGSDAPARVLARVAEFLCGSG
jgi:GGDEF domain-containing protein